MKDGRHPTGRASRASHQAAARLDHTATIPDASGTMTYTVEPIDHWKAGDRAYCIRGVKKGGRYILETGRIYAVAEVRRIRGMMSDGLRLADASAGDEWGFWSHHFACIRRGELPIEQLAKRCRRGWLEAYEECRDGRNAIAMETRRAIDAKGGVVAKP
jgi:hypothetical protein